MNNFAAHNIEMQFDDDGGRQLVLHDVSLEVIPGEFLAIMGPSGCGKSTLLRIMAGLIKSTTGEVLNRPKNVGFVFQNFGLMPWLTVEQNIGYGLKMTDWPKAKQRHIVNSEIERLGLGGLEKSHPKELSGGQKQRVGLARALAIQPSVLLLDEAFSALDAFTAEELRRDLLKIWKSMDMTIVMVTHLPSEAAAMADRILVLSGSPGRIVKEINVELDRPRQERSGPFYKLVDELESLIRRG